MKLYILYNEDTSGGFGNEVFVVDHDDIKEISQELLAEFLLENSNYHLYFDYIILE